MQTLKQLGVDICESISNFRSFSKVKAIRDEPLTVKVSPSLEGFPSVLLRSLGNGRLCNYANLLATRKD